MKKAAGKQRAGILAHSRWDAIPVILGAGHLCALVGFFFVLPYLSWVEAAVTGLIYSVSISWNINSIAHNFIHNPYFNNPKLNRTFSLIESLAIGFSQAQYDLVHKLHHIGNSDRKDESGKTTDLLSIYRYSHDDRPEGVWSYTFLSYFRDDFNEVYKKLKEKDPDSARWGKFELGCWFAMIAAALVINYKSLLFLIPFYYFGHCLSALNGYYKHYGGNTDEPLAWGVSSYNKLYNFIWLNNGYHAEHHYQPLVHWTKMKQLHEEILAEQQRCGVRVISTAHALGFLDRDLPRLEVYNDTVPKGRISGRQRKTAANPTHQPA